MKKTINENQLRKIIRKTLKESMNSNEMIDTIDEAIQILGTFFEEYPKLQYELQPLYNTLRYARQLVCKEDGNINENYYSDCDGDWDCDWEENQSIANDAWNDEAMEHYERNFPLDFYDVPEDEYMEGKIPPDEMYNEINENKKRR